MHPWRSMRGDTKNSGRFLLPPILPSPTPLRVFKTQNAVFSTPIIDEKEIIYVGSADHNFYAFDTKSGKELWRIETAEIIDSAGCLGESGKIYFAGGDAKLRCVDEKGAQVWEFDVLNGRPPHLFTLSTNYWWEANVSVGPDGAIYAGNDDFYFYCLETDGTLRWAFRTGMLIWSAPAFPDNETVLVAGFDMNLYALDTKTGSLKWKTTLDNCLVASPCVGDDGVIYQGSMDGGCYAVDSKNGQIKWQIKTGGHIYASPAYASDRMIYVASTDGFLYALNSKDRSIKWTFFTGDAIRSSPSLGPDPESRAPYLIYLGGGDGKIFVLEPDGKKRYSVDTEEICGQSDYPNINASIALGKSGFATAKASGEVLWIPYDYYLSPSQKGVSREDDDELLIQRTSWHYFSPAGKLAKSSETNHEKVPSIEVLPQQVISFKLLAEDYKKITPTKLFPETVRVLSTPPFLYDVNLQSDLNTVNIIPRQMLTPNEKYSLTLSASYHQAGAKKQRQETIQLKVVDTENAPEPFHNIKAFQISHMSIPQPVIVPSLDQIGIASLTISIALVQVNPERRFFVAWGLQTFGMNESAQKVGVPEPRSLVYAFNGEYLGDYFVMHAQNCLFEITAFPVPIDELCFSGRMSENCVVRLANMYLAYSLPNFLNSLSNIGKRWRAIVTAGSWLVKQAKEGRKEFIGALIDTTPTFLRMARKKVWREWGLFNHNEEFLGVGTFRTSPILISESPVKASILDAKLKRGRGIEILFKVDKELSERDVMGLLVVDNNNGKPLPIDYNARYYKKITDNTYKMTLPIPFHTHLSRGSVTAFLMCGLHNIAKIPL